MWEFRRVVPPRFKNVFLRPPCVDTDTVRVLVVRTLRLRLPLGHFHLYITTGRSRLYPRSRVFTNQLQLLMWSCVWSVVSKVLGAVRDAV
jgi:hypothetical protein